MKECSKEKLLIGKSLRMTPLPIQVNREISEIGYSYMIKEKTINNP